MLRGVTTTRASGPGVPVAVNRYRVAKPKTDTDTSLVPAFVPSVNVVCASPAASVSALVGFTIPVLFGNVVGGTALFSLISYAQVMREM